MLSVSSRCFRLCVALALAMLVSACNKQPTTTAISVKTNLVGPLKLHYSPANLPVETVLTLSLAGAESVQSIEGVIIGQSMAMGQIPLQFKRDPQGQWQTVFMLGACTDPQMVWQLNLELRQADGQLLKLRDQFQSSLP